jgi:hypothetical protein
MAIKDRPIKVLFHCEATGDSRIVELGCQTQTLQMGFAAPPDGATIEIHFRQRLGCNIMGGIPVEEDVDLLVVIEPKETKTPITLSI